MAMHTLSSQCGRLIGRKHSCCSPPPSSKFRAGLHQKPVLAAATSTLAAKGTASSPAGDRDGTSTASTSAKRAGSGSASRPAAAPIQFKPQDPHDEKLYEEIRGCEHWQDVLDIIADEGLAMSTKRSVQALTRLSTLTCPLSKEERSRLTQGNAAFDQLLALVYLRLPDMKQSQASSTASSLAALGVSVPGPQLQALGDALLNAAAVGQLSARDTASVAHWLSALGARPAKPQLVRIMQRAAELMYAQLGPSDSGAAAAAAASAAGGAAAEAATAAGGNAAADASSPSSSSSPSQLTAGAGGRTTLPTSSRSSGGPAGGPEFTPQGLSMLMHALAGLGECSPELAQLVGRLAVRDMAKFAPQGVSNLLWACAKLRHYSPTLVKASLAFFAQRRAEFKPQEIANMMSAMTQMRHHPQDSARLLLSAMLDHREGMAAADVVSTLHWLASFGVMPGGAAAGRMSARLEVLTPAACSTPELCNALWALALLGETARPAFSSIAAAVPERFERGEMDEGLTRQAFQALLSAKVAQVAAQEAAASAAPTAAPGAAAAAAAAAAAVPSFPAPMLDAMKRSWVSSVQRGAAAAADESSPTRIVSQLAGALRVRHDAARATKDGLVLVDVALRPTDERFVALQVLREFDCTRNTGQLLGSLQFERQILEKNGWEVKYLRFSDLLLVGERERPYFMAEFLRSLGCRSVKEVAAPGAKPAAAAAAAGGRGGYSDVSDEAREADIVLRDPKAGKGQGGGGGRGALRSGIKR